MGKKPLTAIMVINLIHEVIILAGVILSVVAVMGLGGGFSPLQLVFASAGRIINLICCAVCILFTTAGIVCVLKDKRNTVLTAAVWISMIVNFFRIFGYAYRSILYLKAMQSVNSAVPAHGQLNIVLLATSGHGVFCVVIVALMAAVLINMPKEEM